MKTHIKQLFLLPALITVLGFIPAGRVTAQTFTILHTFNYGSDDGGFPEASLILSGNTLYGTTYEGGSATFGTVFSVNTNGAGFTILYSFTQGTNGGYPQAGLILLGNTLYGTTRNGGGTGLGTVFAVNTNGTGFTNLYNFSTIQTNSVGAYTNSDGAVPLSGLISSGNTLYGTTAFGGSGGYGTVFAISNNGTGFTTLHGFTAGTEGVYPQAGLILSGNTLYGTAGGGGSSGAGTVFAIMTDGTRYTNLHSFTATSSYTNSDGAYPKAAVILSGNTLYGTAQYGGTSGSGTVFKVNPDGLNFTTLYSFRRLSNSSPFTNSDGAYPEAALILSGNTLYGTAYQGGSVGLGTVFSLSLGAVSAPPPQLTIIRSGANVILTWSTSATGFTLQSTTNLVSTAVWITNAPAPVVINGQNAVTNPIAGTRKFYRLSQ
jgi:uncharacterized repeat protein (TIGR03803 family)